MPDDDHADPDLDTLTRAQLAEIDGPAWTVANVLDDWLHRLHGATSSSHGAGLFLDLLAAEGWRVTAIGPVPPLRALLDGHWVEPGFGPDGSITEVSIVRDAPRRADVP